ncbi:TPA: DUF262 domain-containing protein [Burkholderia vietnamiensis]|uniref:DUF262 domain-containing protein n=1 Tax=Burkholderia vietnamiensis TaxID=60552 RepID=UPI001B99C9EC|nr:DUF262 domain-containing protein [Burkholderia vietnamiensis]MBR7997547.1 DUF262 domain-containing protein [Burkholderia vietnamiensis]HDR9180972.1 DUF262 domain-containing protein [Burkholderia vietnamiensis]
MAFSSAELQRLGDLLAGYHFHIPDYQRGFAWGEAQLEALWNDLHVTVSSQAKEHFTGVVLLRQLNEDNATLQSVELIDGQQRVISAMTLASALARRASASEGESQPAARHDFKVSFLDNAELQTYFNFWTLNDENAAARVGPDCSSYAANLKNAAQYFRKRAAELPDAFHARQYLDVLLDRFRLFVLDAHPDFDIHVAFETLNNRGKKLSTLELLKNRLIYLTNVLPSRDAEVDVSTDEPHLNGRALREQVHLAWKGIYTSLGRSPATQNHDDEFLRAHAVAYFGEVKDADWLDNVLLNETFTAKNKSLALEDVSAYIRNLEQAAVWWSHVHETKLMPTTHQLHLERIARIGHAYFKPLLLAAYMRATALNSEALGEPRAYEADIEPVAGLLEQVERFIVLVLNLSGRASHLGRSHMNRMAHSLLRPDSLDCPWKDKGLPTMPADDAIAFAKSYVKAYIDNEEVGDSWSDPRFEWVGVYSAADVQRQVAARLREGTGYYRWPFARLLLLEYEEARREAGNKPIALEWPWDEFSFDKTVEHIFPQTPDEDGYWDRAIPIDGRAKALRKAVVHSLGNLMLLSNKVNSSVSNLPFRAKGGTNSKLMSYEVGSHSETQVAQVFRGRDWTVACIAARGIAMLKFAEERWSFRLTEAPDNYSTYLPYLFGDKADAVYAGEASNGRQVDGRALNALVDALLG